MKKQSLLVKEISDGNDGFLTVVENFPFEVKRVYFIDKIEIDSLRGFHAHKELSQIIFCLKGSFDLELYDGKKSKLIRVKKKGFLIKPYVWHIMRNFTEDCLICVFASDIYKESDYIRSFHEFKQIVK